VPANVLQASTAAAVPSGARWMMDRIVPLSLFSGHPDRPDVRADLARMFAYVRSHWVKMPPTMLIIHLARKFWTRQRLQFGRHP
jgi:hypothetical protein